MAKTSTIWIALLRGINVGGAGKLPMKELKEILELLGAREVATYIQSGNAVFRHAEARGRVLEGKIAGAVAAGRGFEPRVLLLARDELSMAIADNPFPEARSEPKRLHFGFLAEGPSAPDLERLDRLRSGDERWQLSGRVFYLHAPAGIGRSKLAAGAEKALGVAMTVRNANTVLRLDEMAQSL